MRRRARHVRRLSYLAVARVPGTRAHSLQIVKTCEALSRRLDEIELVVPCLGTVGAGPPGVRMVRVAAPDFLPLGRWAPGWLMRILFDVQSFAFALLAVARALCARRFDAYYTRSPLVALVFSFMYGSRVVHELHVPAGGTLRRMLLRLCCVFGCRFVAISEALGKRLASDVRIPPGQIGVAHDGHDPALFEHRVGRAETRRALGLAEDAFAICYVGSAATLGAGKGVEFIVEAFRAAGLGNAALLLAGIEARAVSGCGADVRCLGRIAPEEVAALLGACDAAVMSFPEDPDYARAMSPLKLSEYMGAGLPIIAPDLPNLREVLDENCALFVPLGDPHALVNAIRRLHSDATLRTRLGAAAAERARSYTWEARATRLLEFLQSSAS